MNGGTTLEHTVRFLDLDGKGCDVIVRRYCEGIDTHEQARLNHSGSQTFEMVLALAMGCRFGNGFGIHKVRGYVLPPELIIHTTGTTGRLSYRVCLRMDNRTLFRAATVPEAAAWIRQQHGPHAFVDREELVREVKRRWRRRRELVLWLMQAENKDARMAEFAVCCRTRLIDDLRARHGFAVEAEALTA